MLFKAMWQKLHLFQKFNNGTISCQDTQALVNQQDLLKKETS